MKWGHCGMIITWPQNNSHSSCLAPLSVSLLLDGISGRRCKQGCEGLKSYNLTTVIKWHPYLYNHKSSLKSMYVIVPSWPVGGSMVPHSIRRRKRRSYLTCLLMKTLKCQTLLLVILWDTLHKHSIRIIVSLFVSGNSRSISSLPDWPLFHFTSITASDWP